MNLFEDKVQLLLEQTKKKVYRKQDIVNKYGPTITIDHMIVYKDDNFIICFQDKNTNNSITINDFNNFTNSVNTIANTKQMYGIGIFISNKSFSLPSKNMMEIENSKYNNKQSLTYYYNICDINEIKLLQKVQDFLHQQSIYMYDNDGDTIMGNILL
jgi:hypothetical protein